MSFLYIKSNGRKARAGISMIKTLFVATAREHVALIDTRDNPSVLTVFSSQLSVCIAYISSDHSDSTGGAKALLNKFCLPHIYNTI